MRLTVNLERDLYAVAKAMAKTEDCSLSAAVNRLLRRALEHREPGSREDRNGFPVARCRRRFSSVDVDSHEEEDVG